MTSGCYDLQMNASMEGKRTQIIAENAGELEQMGVEFRDVDPFNLWVRHAAGQIIEIWILGWLYVCATFSLTKEFTCTSKAQRLFILSVAVHHVARAPSSPIALKQTHQIALSCMMQASTMFSTHIAS